MGVGALALAAAVLAGAAFSADANDRPFLISNNAIVDDDNDGNWAFETFWQRTGPVRALTVAPEYSFNPQQSLQLLYTGLRERDAPHPPSTLEFEYKHLLNNIARDGYGIGWHVSLNTEFPAGARWRSERLSARGLFTLPLRDGEAYVHVNAGLGKSRDGRREWIGSMVFEHALPWRTHAFVEVGREERATLLHTGLRHWIKKERLAVDLTVQQLRSEGGRRDSGVVFGIGWYDL